MFATSLLFILTAATAEPAQETFAIPLSDLVHREEEFGIINGRMTIGVNYKSLADISGLFAPPYVSSDFRFTCLMDGKPIPASNTGNWWPNCVADNYSADRLSIGSETILPYGNRAAVISITLHSGGIARDIVLTGSAGGTLDKNERWEFARPESSTATTAAIEEIMVTPTIEASILGLTQGDLAIIVGADDLVQWNADGTWTLSTHLDANAPLTVRFVVAIGPADEARATCKEILGANTKTQSNSELVNRVAQYLAPVPRFTSDNKQLEKLYSRSLAHGFLNRWEVPEFKLNPYYSTGSIKGGCVCNYLWDFGEVWEMLPLLDPAATKAHIKQFLSIDLTKHFAFLPLTGEGFGPWYMVNQEKIIGLVYYYVMITGDTAFLNEMLNGRSILDHMIEHATYGDDATKPVALMDYGASNSHLELRKELKYNHVMPDLNGRRYNNFVFAAKLSELMGKPRPDLVQRAEELKQVLHAELWDPQAKWFAFRNDKGEKELRYTCQMFKLFNSPVLNDESLAGLLSHWNTNEFLGDYGLHSLAKGDPAYDENDVDNGGPGACTGFAPQIMERLYKSGHTAEADEMLKSILWWGQKLPYWGDSLYADRPDYRKDTPLQSMIDGLAVAQMMIYGLFGITPNADGSITINPHLPSIAKEMTLRNVKLRGHDFSVHVQGDSFTVENADDTVNGKRGTPVTLPPK